MSLIILNSMKKNQTMQIFEHGGGGGAAQTVKIVAGPEGLYTAWNKLFCKKSKPF
jgi:hypothetical protein